MKNINSINGGHLIDSKYYIQTGIYDAPGMKIPVSMIIDDANYIDYYRNNQHVAEKNLESSNHNSFAISKIDSSNKYSKNYLNCTGVVAVGESKENGENISFLTHQNVISFLKNRKVDLLFKEKLIKSLNELKEKSNEGTIDIIVLGGNDYNEYDEYIETIQFLNEVIFESLGFSPFVVGGPTVNEKAGKENTKDIVLKTHERKTYLFKKYSEASENINFVANNVSEILKKVN